MNTSKTVSTTPDLEPVAGRVSTIYTPADLSEQLGVSGFAFSKRVAAKTGPMRGRTQRAAYAGTKRFELADLAARLESDSAGGPSIGTNEITIWVDAEHSNAESEADHIYLYFGRDKRVKLLGSSGRFPAGSTLTWDLNQIAEWLEDNVATDLWDELALVNESGDGIKIDRVRVKHSSQTILDWECGLWLDGSKLEEYGKLVLTGKIMMHKLDQIDGNWLPQVHWGIRELGKSDGTKYGSTGAWCSEFSSWCLRKSLWDTPSGNIGSQAMEDYFAGIGRKFTQDEVLDGDYTLVAGDYVRFEWSSGGQHSGIFIEYLDDPSSPSESTEFRTIEGNASSTVKLATRKLRDVLSVGNCQ